MGSSSHVLNHLGTACRENPNLKTIIIIRDPLERFKSHHRFLYEQNLQRGLGDMNKVVEIALAPGSRLDKIYQLALPALKDMQNNYLESQAIEQFLNATINFNRPERGANMSFQRATSSIYHSLYFHPIYNWDRIHGRENVYVVEGERITMHRSAKRLANKLRQNKTLPQRPLRYTGFKLTKTLEEEIDEIFRFLGLRPMHKLPNVYLHKTTHKVPPEHQLTAESKAKLEEFYDPFNEILKHYLMKRRSVS
jgi:hypothetical protein